MAKVDELENYYYTTGKVEGDYVTDTEGGGESFPSSLISGIPTFLKSEVLPPETDMMEDAGVKAAMLGFPWEATNTCRPGTSYGPRAVRLASEHYLGYHAEYGTDLHESLNLVDAGDIGIVPGSIPKTFARAEKCVRNIVQAGAFPVVFGGDDSCPIPIVNAVAGETDGDVGYIHVDSHMDTAESVGGMKNNHATTVTRAMDNDNVSPENVALVGMNGPLNPPGGREFAEETGITMRSIWDIDDRGIEDVAQEAIEVASDGTDRVVLHTDLDVIDQGFVPGVTTPEPAGLTPREALKMMRVFAEGGIDAHVIVECSPVHDIANMSARVAVRLAMDVLGVRANPDGSGRL